MNLREFRPNFCQTWKILPEFVVEKMMKLSGLVIIIIIGRAV
jgi:hypothetical protein